MGAIEGHNIYGLTVRESANDGSDFTNPGADYRRVFLGEDGQLHARDSAGTVTTLGGGTPDAADVVFDPTALDNTAATDVQAALEDYDAAITAAAAGGALVQSSNQAIAVATAGWTRLGPMVGFGTAAAAGSMRLGIFWKRHDGSETDPTVTDPGDHAVGQVMTIRGCPTVGDPFESVGQRRKTTASTTGTAEGGATTSDNCLVVNAFAHALDSASAVFSSFTNADLSSISERIDVATTDGTGGGIGVSTGEKTDAGTFTGTTVTETSTTDVSSTFILLPNGARPLFDRQVFITPDLADTWVKRSGAQTVRVTAIGGGGSGSAGRNAATAAGGGGGGGGQWAETFADAANLPATMTVTAGSGGAATANTDGTAGNNGVSSQVVGPSSLAFVFAGAGTGAGVSASGSGGVGGNGGGRGSALAASTVSYTIQPAGGGTGGTTAGAGGGNVGPGGGAGAGGGTTQATSAGGLSLLGGAGGGGGRSNTNVGTGGFSISNALAGGATAGANGADSPLATMGGSGAAGGTSAAGPGGTGGWPSGGGGGGGSQSGAQRGGAGGDGVVVIVTDCA
jgi:hypothetical protein